MRESISRKGFLRSGSNKFNTLYFGGGTPSLINPETIGLIATSICEDHGLGPLLELDEFTVEVNPDDASVEYLSGLYDAGVRRLSLGVQSLLDSHLKWMNRRHDAKTALAAFKNAREAGFENISIDLIFGFASLSMVEWKFNLDRAIDLKPEHISSYQMSIEPGTKLGREYAKGSYSPPEDDFSYVQYSMLQSMLANAGYIQYEVSSFALEGKEAMHNSSYWNHTPYLGLGPAAHSFDGVRRYANKPSLTSYINRYSYEEISMSALPNYKESYQTSETLSYNDLLNETLMLSLRKLDGLNLNALFNRFPKMDKALFMKDVNKLMESGSLVMKDGKITIPSDKLFLSDGIIRELFR